MIAKLLCRNIIMTSKICPKTGREVFCADNAKRPMNSFESHCSHVSPFEAELNPGSFLILGVPGGVAPVWSWADKSPCLANSASMTTSGWKHWRKSGDISGNSKLGEVTWIGLLFEFHLSSTCPANYRRPSLRLSVGTGHIMKNCENPTTCDKEWTITRDKHLSCILGSPNCERSNSNSTVTGKIDYAMQRRLLRWTTQNSQTAHVAASFLWRLIKHPFNIAASFCLPHMCCRRFAGRPERCSGTVQTVHRGAEFRKEGNNSRAGPWKTKLGQSEHHNFTSHQLCQLWVCVHMELAEAKLQPAYRAYRAPVDSSVILCTPSLSPYDPLIGLTIQIVTGLIYSEQNQIV